MRRASSTDANQPEIVEALRAAGASVQILAAVGGGCPDLLVGYRGHNYLMEVKDDAKPPSKRGLTDKQKEWIRKWRGSWTRVENVRDALQTIGAVGVVP
jgi:hypothetical protein